LKGEQNKKRETVGTGEAGSFFLFSFSTISNNVAINFLTKKIRQFFFFIDPEHDCIVFLC